MGACLSQTYNTLFPSIVIDITEIIQYTRLDGVTCKSHVGKNKESYITFHDESKIGLGVYEVEYKNILSSAISTDEYHFIVRVNYEPTAGIKTLQREFKIYTTDVDVRKRLAEFFRI